MAMHCERCTRWLSGLAKAPEADGQFCPSCKVYVNTVDQEKKIRVVQLWRLLGHDDVIQPDDHYASSLSGHLCRCTPAMMGKKLPYMHMPHMRPAGTRVETIS